MKKTFLRTDKETKPYLDLQKYNLIKQAGIENTFVALDVIVNKCRPTALDRPPQFNCEIKPPVCFTNMTFSELTVYRKVDNKLMHIIKPGGYAYLYEGIEHDPAELNKIIEEDEKDVEKEALTLQKAKPAQSEIEIGKLYL